MNGKNDISEELRSLSALVATISRQTPYEAPEGYFIDFPVRALQGITGRKGSNPLTFNVPEGYFEGFAHQLLNRIKAGAAPGAESAATKDDMASLGASDPVSPVLAQAGRRTPYAVPEGYFDAIAPILAVARNSNPYAVPADYFDTVSPVLTVAGSSNPYTAPAGYFEGLDAVIMARLALAADEGPLTVVAADELPAGRPVAPQARVIGLGARGRSWMKYSAAAVMAGLLLTVGWLRLHQAGHAPANAPATLDIAKTMSTVSDGELQSFLVDQDTTLAQPTNSTATLDMDDSDLKTLLGNVPDGELKQYMEEHGGANDIATN